MNTQPSQNPNRRVAHPLRVGLVPVAALLLAACGSSDDDSSSDGSAAVGDTVTTEVTTTPATEPAATEPETTEPVATETETTEPETTEPVATETETTEPVATEPETTEAPGPSPEEFAATMGELHTRMNSSVRPDALPFSDLALLASMGRDLQEVIADIADELDTVDEEVIIADGMLAALAEWDASLEEALVAMEAGGDALQQRSADWVANREGPPPRRVTDVADWISGPGPDAYQAACVEAATEAELALDCATVTRDPSGPTDEGPVEFTIGGATLTVDPPPAIEVVAEDDLLEVLIDPGNLVTVGPPTAVADPTLELDPDVVASPIPWPDDVGAWGEELGSSVETGEVDIGGVTYTTTRLEGLPARGAVIERIGPVDEDHLLFTDSTIHVWEGEVGGQMIVVVLTPHSPSEGDALVADVEAMIASITPVG